MPKPWADRFADISGKLTMIFPLGGGGGGGDKDFGFMFFLETVFTKNYRISYSSEIILEMIIMG